MPHVVHLPGNDVLVDARVLKYMATTANLGLKTTGLGVKRSAGDAFYRMGEADIVVAGVPAAATPAAPATPADLSRRRVLSQIANPSAASPQVLDDLAAEIGRRSRGLRRTGASMLKQAARMVLRGPRLFELKVQRRLLFQRAAAAGVERPNSMEREQEIEHYLTHPDLVPWRTELPYISEDEQAIGGWLDRLAPDIVHVHDVFMLGVAAGYVERAKAAGRLAHLVYDAHEYLPGLATVPPRTLAAYVNLEHEFVPKASRVVTVSPLLASWLTRDHGGIDVDVVLNAPISVTPPADFRDLRDLTGVPEGTTLMVYGGGIGRPRGIQTAVEALPKVPDVHVALVTNRPAGTATKALLAQAKQLGVLDRFHVAPYVNPEHVTTYFARCTAGLSTLLHAPNHDAALTNKFCEYLQSGLPIITSDTTAQAEAVRDLDLGAVYVAGDADDLATAITTVMSDLDRLRSRIAADDDLRFRYSWDGQVATIATLYGDLLGTELPVPPRGQVQLTTPEAR